MGMVSVIAKPINERVENKGNEFDIEMQIKDPHESFRQKCPAKIESEAL